MENPYQPPAAEPPLLPPPSRQGLRNLGPLAATSLWLYGISVALETGQHVLKMFVKVPPGNLHDTLYVEGPTALDWAMIVTGFGAMIPYFLWKYRAAKNAGILDPASMTVSPAMAVGSYFIPLVNLVVPCRAMAQIARASTGSIRGVAAWWSGQIASMFLGSLIGFMRGAGASLPPALIEHVYIVVGVLTFIASWKLVMDITRAQGVRHPDPA